EIHRHNCIGGRGGRLGVSVAGTNIERTPFGIDGRRIPYSCARWRPALHTVGVPADLFWLLWNRVRFPNLAARRGSQRDHTASESAAGIGRADARAFLTRGDRHVHTIVE